MTHPWDEFSKSLAESVPRRESLRRLGIVFAGAALSPFAAPLAWARGQDPCKAFCNQCPKWARSQCLAACQACSGNTSRLCGACGSYACCSNSGLACCGGACVDLFDDLYNCGGCGIGCDEPVLYEEGACVDGNCMYQCISGAVRCNGTCTFLDSDPNNCGACGNVCPASGSASPTCYGGICGECMGNCPPGWCGGNGCGGECSCPSGWECGETGWCYDPDPCPGGGTRCNGVCTNISFDTLNCGGCGIVCAGGETCSGGVCQLPF